MHLAQRQAPTTPRAAYADQEVVWNALLDRYRAGDTAALDALARALYPAIHRIVFRLAGTRRRDAHDDLVQAVLEQVCRSIGGFEGRSRLSSFVFGICHRVITRAGRYDRVRSFYRRDAELATTSDDPAQADELCDRARVVIAARRRLDLLKVDERSAFVLFEVEELPLEEVAVALSCSTRTVKRKLRSARKKLLRVV